MQPSQSVSTKKALSRREIAINNFLICTGFLVAATVAATVFSYISDSFISVSMFYILSVLMIARYTEGYIPGIIASVVCTIFVNLVFTYPYMELNFHMRGYPVTFLCMLTVATITSAATTRMKAQSIVLNEREKLLMEAEKEKMRANLLRAISHDLRTPLTSIIGTSSTYLENSATLSDSEKSALVQNIYDDSNWLLNMVENLLSITRIRDGNTQVTKIPEPLEEVVSEAVQRLKKRIPNAVIKVRIPDDFIMIPMDAMLIEQVLINLIENAFYHGNPNMPIYLNTYIEDNMARFQISDYGPGIPEDRLSTIFDGASYACQSTDSRKGMGIGLSICKTIISAHSGTITASNATNGACITFSLPLGGQQTNDT